MKTIKNLEVDSLIQSYCGRKTFEKPLLLRSENSDPFIKIEEALLKENENGNVVDLLYCPESKKLDLKIDNDDNQIVGGIVVRDKNNNIKKVFYHPIGSTYQSRFDYCIEILQQNQIPVICCVEEQDVITAARDDYLAEHFEQYFIS